MIYTFKRLPADVWRRENRGPKVEAGRAVRRSPNLVTPGGRFCQLEPRYDDRDGERESDLGYVSKVKIKEFGNGIYVGKKKKGAIKNDQGLMLSDWENNILTY